jgi:uncharacterized protein
MRISETCIAVAAVLALGATPSLAFETTRSAPAGPMPVLNLEAPRPVPPAPVMSVDPRAAVPPPSGLAMDVQRGVTSPSIAEATRCGMTMARAADKKALSALQYQAEQGQPAAQLQLGSMFARGDGVPRDDLKAFDYFNRIAESHVDEEPGTPQARIAANAFVALGCYYLEGIPNTRVRADPEEARNRFHYAATYFGDPDAQYHLARTMLDGVGGPRAPQQAVKWLGLAAGRGQHQAQAVLGRLLFEGAVVRRQAARGLMWLSLARDSATPEEVWIVELWDAAFKQASDDERAMALKYIEEWVRGRRR